MPLVLCLLPLIVLLAVAVATDLHARRIPNWLNLLIVVTGLTNALAWGQPTTPTQAVFGLLVGFGILILPFALGAMGGGDVKMLAGVGAWLGPIATLQVYAVAAVCGLLIVLTQCLANGRLTQLVRNSTLIAANFANYAQVGKETVIASGQSLRSVDKPLPYAVPTLVGVLVTIGMNLV
jgi:prepilin peptidase CpaA